MSVGVVLAVYNGEDWLKEQLESIASQTRLPDSLYIRDDGSKDSSRKIVEEFMDRHPELQIEFEAGANLGFKSNFRRLLEAAEEDWIFLCDQDDRWHPDKIETMLRTVQNLPKAQILASSFSFMDADSNNYEVPQKKGWSNQNLIPREIPEGEIAKIALEELVFHNYFQGCSMMISRNIRDAYLRAENPFLPHDWMLSLLAAAKDALYFVNRPLFDYRIHSKNTIGLPQSSRHAVFDRLKTLNTEYNRTIVIRQSCGVLDTIRLNLPEVWNSNADFENLRSFARKNLEALESRSAKSLLFLMKDSLYRRYKSKAGILMDFVFVLTHPAKRDPKKEKEEGR